MTIYIVSKNNTFSDKMIDLTTKLLSFFITIVIVINHDNLL